MKDSKVEYEEWWEVAEEYFTKELEKHLAQHRADERIMMYKLKVYQKQILDFVCGSPTNIEASNKDEEVEARLGEIVQEEEVQTKEP
jgi:hypothetical protein